MREKYYKKIDKKAFFYPKDFQRMLSLASKKQEFNLLCMINTGARINEIRNVKKQDLDEERKNVLLLITKTRAKLKEDRPSPRIIPVSTGFFKYFNRNINKYEIYSTNNYKVFLQQLAKKAGVKNWKDFSSHNVRKTFACWMLALGVNGFKLAQHLGHSVDMLRTHYASPDIFNFEDKDRMRELLNDLPSRFGN